MSCLSSTEFLTCQQIWELLEHSGKVALWGTHSILLRRRNGQEFHKLCWIHWCAILLMSRWSRVLQYFWILQYSTVFYNICRFTYTQKLQYSSVEGSSRGWQGNCQVDTSSHSRNHHYRHNTICCWCYMVVRGVRGWWYMLQGGVRGYAFYAMDAAIMHVPHKSCTLPRDCPRGTGAVNLN